MSMRSAIVGCLLSIGAAGSAFADECAIVKPFVAQQAVRMLKPGDTVQNFCQACGDHNASPMRVESVTVDSNSNDPGSVRVLLNGREIDLAYVYVQPVKGGHWMNLGAMAQCLPTLDAPNFLEEAQVAAVRDKAGPVKPGCEDVESIRRRGDVTYADANHVIDCMGEAK